MGHFIKTAILVDAPFFYFCHFEELNFSVSTTKWGVAQPMQIGCLKGSGATPDKHSEGICLDTDIACQSVARKNYVNQI